MTRFSFDFEWLQRGLDYPEETATFAAVKAIVADAIVTRTYNPRLNVGRERINVPVFQLALGVAREWWTLLYEPERDQPDLRETFTSRHRLDGHLPGFLFPALAVWSAGRDVMTVSTPARDDPAKTASIDFVERLPDRAFLPRFEVEAALSDLVEATLTRLTPHKSCAEPLREAWDRIRTSSADPAERAYCESAGRLGIDPYDPDGLDLTTIATSVPEGLFASLCEASAVDEIGEATEFAAAQLGRLQAAPEIEIGPFSAPPKPHLTRRAALDGYAAARLLRHDLGLAQDPRQAIRQLLGPVADRDPIRVQNRVSVVEGVAERLAGKMRAVVVARNQGQQRFRLCRATYLAWTATHDTQCGVTIGRTREQQASRAFSAELIAPEEFLRERAGPHGLTDDDVDDLATDLDCATQLIRDQIQNHDIPYRG